MIILKIRSPSKQNDTVKGRGMWHCSLPHMMQAGKKKVLFLSRVHLFPLSTCYKALFVKGFNVTKDPSTLIKPKYLQP